MSVDVDRSLIPLKLWCVRSGLNSHYFQTIGDGHHQPNSRGLYTHYKDSLLKVFLFYPLVFFVWRIFSLPDQVCNFHRSLVSKILVESKSLQTDLQCHDFSAEGSQITCVWVAVALVFHKEWCCLSWFNIWCMPAVRFVSQTHMSMTTNSPKIGRSVCSRNAEGLATTTNKST